VLAPVPVEVAAGTAELAQELVALHISTSISLS
jgi:hypothetical protein